jgi:hypothetical protein
MVHRGYNMALLSLWDQIVAFINKARSANPALPLYFPQDNDPCCPYCVLVPPFFGVVLAVVTGMSQVIHWAVRWPTCASLISASPLPALCRTHIYLLHNLVEAKAS